jgi:predicted lactoylglutathione lyase
MFTSLSRRLPAQRSMPSRAAVDAFYRAAIAAGGKDNGPPGLRPHYHANYYGAFVLDPNGHNIEAVCHPRSSSEAVAHQKKTLK